MENKIIKAAIYIRVSTDEQARHGYSLNSQKERLTEFCKQNKYKIEDIYADEGKSARSKMNNRKELLRLIDDVKTHKIDRIVFWRLDRWFRNIKDYYKIEEILEKNKVDWECSDEEYNTHTSNGRLHLNIKLSIAQNESDQTSDRIKFNFENMVKNKRAIQGTQCMPLGYKVVGEEKNKHVVKDEETEEIVKDMFDYFHKHESIRRTNIYINKKYNLTIQNRNITGYLKNKLYTGTYRNIDNYCEAYITKQEYEDIQQKIKRNVKQWTNKYDYIFSGLLKCPECGYKLSGNSSQSSKDGKTKYRTYRCSLNKNSKLCSYSSCISENVLERYLINNFKSELSKFIINSESIQEKQNIRKKNVKPLEAKLDRLNDLYINGKITKDKYELEYNKVDIEIKEISKEQKKERDLTPYKELLNSNGLDVYNKLNNFAKRTFWSNFIDFIIKDNEGNFIIHFK